MMTPLATKVAEVIDQAIQSPDGYAVWRGDIINEHWKIIAEYNGLTEKISIVTKRRDRFTLDENNQ